MNPPGYFFRLLSPRLYGLVCQKIRAQFVIDREIGITQEHLDNVDLSDENPYLRYMMLSKLNRLKPDEHISRETEFAYVCPDETALLMLIELGPLVEIGAGRGYWAQQITQRGGNIIAYDNEPQSNTHFEILKGDHQLAATHVDRALFLCYPDPPIFGTQASDSLEAYTLAGGKTLAVVCNDTETGSGDEWFFRMLNDHDGYLRYYGSKPLAPFFWRRINFHKLPEVQVTKKAELQIYVRKELE